MAGWDLTCRMDWRIGRWEAVGFNADEAIVVFVEDGERSVAPLSFHYFRGDQYSGRSIKTK